MPNPWSALKQFWENMDLEGREKFERLAGEEARNTATVYHTITMAGLGSACLMAVYFLIFVVLLLGMPDDRGNIASWWRILSLAFWLGWGQGGFLGAVLGYGQAFLWQGDRTKAGSTFSIYSSIMVAAMAYAFLKTYDPEVSLGFNLLLSFVFMGPGFLVAVALISWGIKLLKASGQ